MAALLLGSREDCSHYALFVDAMDSNRLGEALSPIAWAICSALYRSSVSMLLCLEEIGGSFLLQNASKWRVQDGDCPSINPVSVVVQAWSSGDDVQIVHYSCVALVGQLGMLCGCLSWLTGEVNPLAGLLIRWGCQISWFMRGPFG